MTPDRARAVIRAQSEFPYWGNYERFMTPDELAHCRERFNNHPSGNITFAGIVHRIARADLFDAPPDFDEKDAEIARDRLAIWNARQGPRVGDWVDMLDGTQRRFTHHWGDSIQTTCGNVESGSFYFYGESMSFSGSLDPAIPINRLQDTGEIRHGRAWFFHHSQSGAGRGVYFTVPCRVFRQV
jgi:hypothetical protein